MNTLSVVISLLGLLYICNAENSRLLLQTPCICPADIISPVCCDGNTEFSNLCEANCEFATNCILTGTCDEVEKQVCAATTCPSGTECQLKDGGLAGEVECVQIPDYCTSASDCAVKNVGNCCGYYPGCVNTNYIPDLQAVKDECVANNMVSICGWREPSGCTCQKQRCVEEYGPITPLTTSSNNCDPLPEGYTLVGTPQTCPLILYMCVAGYTYWGNDECGCGCKPDCSTLPSDYRILANPDQCDTVRIACNIGEEFFRNDCGCGCKQIVNPCAFTTCLIGTTCVDNGDGTASCVQLQKQQCRIRAEQNGRRKCDDGYECVPDPRCDGNVIGRIKNQNKGVCLKKGGSCGGFVGAPCKFPGEECAYPCGSSLGECVTYQYK